MKFIVTADGHEIDVEHGFGTITLEAIAHSLAQINRFNGHALRPYSVAEHSLLVVEILERDFIAPWPDALLAALMHDAHEAFCGDLHSPGKSVIGAAWHHWEERFESMVRSTFKLHTAAVAYRDIVHQADLVALATEHRDLLPNAREMTQWPVLNGVKPVDWVNLREPARMHATWEDWRMRFVDKVDELQFARQLLALPDRTAEVMQ